MEHYKIFRNEIVAGDVNPHYINPRQGLDRLQKLMDEYCAGVTVNYMTNEKLLNIGLKKMKIMEEDLESLAAEDIHELLRAWELKHRFLTSEAVFQHTLFRKETRWPGYYYRGDHMKLDDEDWHVLTVSRRDPKTGEYTMEKAPLYHLVGEKDEMEDKAPQSEVKLKEAKGLRRKKPGQEFLVSSCLDEFSKTSGSLAIKGCMIESLQQIESTDENYSKKLMMQ